MFDNIGGKIKGWAKVNCFLGMGASILMGIVLFNNSYRSEETLAAILLMALGCLVSWVSSLTLYGFGQMVENSDILAGRVPRG